MKMSGQRDSNPLLKFRDVAQFQRKYAVGCALSEKTHIGEFARFAQNYAVPVSEIVRKKATVVHPNSDEDSTRPR